MFQWVIPFIVVFAVFFGALVEAFFKLHEFEKRLDHISRTQVLFDGTLLREITRQVAEMEKQYEQEASGDADVNRDEFVAHDSLREGSGHVSTARDAASKSESWTGEEFVGTRCHTHDDADSLIYPYHPHTLRECCVDGDGRPYDCPPRHLTRQLCEELRATDSMQQE